MTETPPDFCPSLRTIAMPADTNPAGDIFGGWLLAQMDLAGSIPAADKAGGRVATVGIEAMRFHKPVMVGDEVSCYTSIEKIGNTSITICVVVYARRRHDRQIIEKVTQGLFTYVALDDQRNKMQIPKE
ncbi:MAG: acyl-CoA thioesterase [Alphaproteobacteria bacterium]